MDKFCSNCGNKLKDNADICLKCGVIINKDINNINQLQKVKNSGKGISIAGMVLGIISLFITLISFL